MANCHQLHENKHYIRQMIKLFACTGIAEYTRVLDDNVTMQWQRDPSRHVTSAIFHKGGEQLLVFVPLDVKKRSKGQFYTSVNNRAVMLHISSLTLENAGRYSCTIYYNTGRAVEETVLLNVQGKSFPL